MGRRAASQEGWADAEVAPSWEGQWAVYSRGRRARHPVPVPQMVPLSSRKGATAPGLRSMGCCGYH